MQLTDDQKKRFLEYVERRKSESNKTANLPQNLFDDMLEDVIKRSGRSQSRTVFDDYIFTHAIQNVEQLLDPTDKETLEKEVTSDNWLFIFTELLSNQKYLIAFVVGYIFGYSKLCYKLKLEPQDSFLSIVNALVTL